MRLDISLPRCGYDNTLQDYKIIKVISKKLVRKAVDIMYKIVEKDESKEEKYSDIDDNTKEVDSN